MNEQTPRMGKPEAAMRLMQLACREGVREEEVIALQVGVRAIAKRHFDRGRNLARRAERKRAGSPAHLDPFQQAWPKELPKAGVTPS